MSGSAGDDHCKDRLPWGRDISLSRRNRRNAAVRKRGCAIILGRGNKMFKTSNMKKSIIAE